MQTSLSPEVLVNERLYLGIGDSEQALKLGIQNLNVLHVIAFTTAAITYRDTWNSQMSVHKVAP